MSVILIVNVFGSECGDFARGCLGENPLAMPAGFFHFP
jgi:hypothetical protein